MARLATSLVTLRNEFDTAFPARDRTADGWIGDAAHASRASRHNPNAAGVVCALDVTHDPSSGCDVHAIARAHVAAGPHPELAYIVSDGQIASRTHGWTWRPYTGSNPHTHHAHWAVGTGPDSDPTPPYDSTQPWGIAGGSWMPDAVILVHPSTSTPDSLAGLLGIYMRPDQDVVLTCNPETAKAALRAGKRVWAVGGKAAELVAGDKDLKGASRIETAEKVIAQARAGW